MTIIAAASGPDGVWIGSDTVADDGARLSDCGPKFIRRKGWAIAAAGFLRSLYLLQQNERQILNLKCQHKIAAEVRNIHEADKFMRGSDTGPIDFGAEFIICSASQVWEVGRTFEVVEVDYTAGGSAYQYGLGAMFCLDKTAKNFGQEAVTAAIKASMNFSPNCGGNCIVQRIC